MSEKVTPIELDPELVKVIREFMPNRGVTEEEKGGIFQDLHVRVRFLFVYCAQDEWEKMIEKAQVAGDDLTNFYKRELLGENIPDEKYNTLRNIMMNGVAAQILLKYYSKNRTVA